MDSLSDENICTADTVRSRRVDSITSCRFYEAGKIDNKIKAFINSTRTESEGFIKQSRHLPFWFWYVIAKCNGIPLNPEDKPILGTILHIVTFGATLTYAVTYMWYIAYDILSPHTKQDIANGAISIFLVTCWCAFGFYAKNLSGRLFCHSRFLKDIRMHARTIFKINAVLLVFLLGALFITANIAEAWFSLQNEACIKIELNTVVCKMLFVAQSTFCIFTLLWNSLVAFVFISVCRTHTIGLRHFIRDIEYDAVIFDFNYAKLYMDAPLSCADICQETMWLDGENSQDDFLSKDEPSDIVPPFRNRLKSSLELFQRQNSKHKEVEQVQFETSPNDGEIDILISPLTHYINQKKKDENNYIDGRDCKANTEVPFIPVREMRKGATGAETPDEALVTPHTMTVSEILHHYWKICCRLRLSSAALQRWYASFVILVILRCATYLVHWLSTPASVFDILQFIVPLLLLTLMSSAIAEVNMEGQRMLRCLYPSEERMKIVQFLSQNPLQMTIYTFSMTHGTIVTVVFAILVGFVTRIIITEMTK